MKEVLSAKESGAASIKARNAVSNVGVRVERGMSSEERGRMHEQLGGGFVMPTYAYQADDYKKATGKSLPKDAVQVVFGRGAANGSDFNDVMSQPKYSHIKVLEARTGEGNKTYLSGYKSANEIRELVDEVRRQQRAGSAARTIRAMYRRKGSLGGL